MIRLLNVPSIDEISFKLTENFIQEDPQMMNQQKEQDGSLEYTHSLVSLQMAEDEKVQELPVQVRTSPFKNNIYNRTAIDSLKRYESFYKHIDITFVPSKELSFLTKRRSFRSIKNKTNPSVLRPNSIYHGSNRKRFYSENQKGMICQSPKKIDLMSTQSRASKQLSKGNYKLKGKANFSQKRKCVFGCKIQNFDDLQSHGIQNVIRIKQLRLIEDEQKSKTFLKKVIQNRPFVILPFHQIDENCGKKMFKRNSKFAINEVRY